MQYMQNRAVQTERGEKMRQDKRGTNNHATSQIGMSKPENEKNAMSSLLI